MWYANSNTNVILNVTTIGKACKHTVVHRKVQMGMKNANATVNAANGLEPVSISANANAIKLTKNFEVASQIGSKKDTPHLHSRTAFCIAPIWNLSFRIVPYREVCVWWCHLFVEKLVSSIILHVLSYN